ncbi:MAG: hypothetical protein JXJ04_13390 [Spirochaetales bacterium]|nr:hypothetical protein [Spirochaetales bacterium]
MTRYCIILILFFVCFNLKAQEPCGDWYDCITQYRASTDNNEKIIFLQEAIRKWKPEDTEEYLSWNKKVLSDEYYFKAMDFYRMYYESKNMESLEKALLFFSLALQVWEQPFILYYRGMMYLEKNDLIKALEDFIHGIDTAPHESYNYIGLVRVHFKKKNYDAPVPALEKGVLLLEKKLISVQKEEERKKIIDDLMQLYGLQVKCQLELQNFNRVLEMSRKAYKLDAKSSCFDLCYYSFLAYCTLAKEAFGSMLYDKALELYREGLTIRGNNREVVNITEPDTGWDYYLNLIEQRKKLGAVKPTNIHKVLNIYIKNIDVSLIETNGKKLSVKNSIDMALKSQMDTDRNISVRLIELFSHGQWTIQSEDILFDGTVTEVSQDYYALLQRELRYPVLGKIEPRAEFRTLIQQNIDKFDTFVIYFSGKGIATAAGGGGMQFPLPGGKLSRVKGWIAFPFDYVWEGDFLPYKVYHLNGWFHEFFHVIQSMTCMNSENCISQIHEYLDEYRSIIPRWKGKGELSYYEWRFSETLAKIGWNKLHFK